MKDSRRIKQSDRPYEKVPLWNDGRDNPIDALGAIDSEPDTTVEIGQGSDSLTRGDLEFIPESQNRIESPKLEKAKSVEASITWLKTAKGDTRNNRLR
jgi:hypothetical protein